MHLDVHHWESFKKNTPNRGRGSIPPVVLGATLLVLWFRHEKLGKSKQVDAIKLMETIHVGDKNPSRGMKKCQWLQGRSDGLVLNPSKVSQAIGVARAYCMKQPIQN
jgi:hypothetical protein